MAPRYCQDGQNCGTAELSEDDIAAVCLVYPPAATSDTLPPPPPINQGCALSTSSPFSTSPSHALGAVAFVLFTSALVRRARRSAA
jgi:hypothetical protein